MLKKSSEDMYISLIWYSKQCSEVRKYNISLIKNRYDKQNMVDTKDIEFKLFNQDNFKNEHYYEIRNLLRDFISKMKNG